MAFGALKKLCHAHNKNAKTSMMSHWRLVFFMVQLDLSSGQRGLKSVAADSVFQITYGNGYGQLKHDLIVGVERAGLVRKRWKEAIHC